MDIQAAQDVEMQKKTVNQLPKSSQEDKGLLDG